MPTPRSRRACSDAPLSEAAGEVAPALGLPRKAVYARALALRRWTDRTVRAAARVAADRRGRRAEAVAAWWLRAAGLSPSSARRLQTPGGGDRPRRPPRSHSGVRRGKGAPPISMPAGARCATSTCGGLPVRPNSRRALRTGMYDCADRRGGHPALGLAACTSARYGAAGRRGDTDGRRTGPARPAR